VTFFRDSYGDIRGWVYFVIIGMGLTMSFAGIHGLFESERRECTAACLHAKARPTEDLCRWTCTYEKE